MAYVKFKRGLESNLQPYLSNYTGSGAKEAEDGCIYLAQSGNDVNPTSTSLGFRLYVGKTINGSTKAYPLTQGALILSDISQLPSASDAIPGQFYYVSNTNILAISSGGRWVQINPQTTNTDNFISNRQLSISNTGNVTTVTDILFNTNGDRLSNNFTFTGNEGFSVDVEPIYAPAGETFYSGVTYYTYSSATNTYTVASVDANNYSSLRYSLYVVKGYGLSLTPTVYSLTKTVTSNTATITLTDDTTTPANGHTSSVVLKGGDGVSFAEDATTGAIQINTSSATIRTMSFGSGNNSRTSGGAVIPDTPPSPEGFYAAVVDSDNTTVSASFNPKIRIGGGMLQRQLVSFRNDGQNDNGECIATLDVYTTAEVDAIKNNLNAMTYKGVLQVNQLPTTNVSNGDVYMAGTSLSIPAAQVAPANENDTPTQTNVGVGDLIIAQGAEVDGYIPANNIKWATVTSGTSFDTNPTINFSSVTHGFVLGKTTAGELNPTTLGTFRIAVNNSVLSSGSQNKEVDNDYLVVSDDANTGATTRVVRVEHRELHTLDSNNKVSGTTVAGTSTQSGGVIGDASTLTIPVPTITYDKAGHIVGVSITNYVVTDSHSSITSSLSVSGSVAVQSNENIATQYATTATVTNTLNIDSSTEVLTTSLNLASDSLVLRAKEATNSHMISMNIEWGSFDEV